MLKADKQNRSKSVAGFGERMNAAAAASKARLEKCRSVAVDVTAPDFLERQEIRQAAASARLERDRRRKAEKDEAKATLFKERKAAQEAAARQAIADQESDEAAKIAAAAALVALADGRKALRDARYAARKAAKR